MADDLAKLWGQATPVAGVPAEVASTTPGAPATPSPDEQSYTAPVRTPLARYRVLKGSPGFQDDVEGSPTQGKKWVSYPGAIVALPEHVARGAPPGVLRPAEEDERPPALAPPLPTAPAGDLQAAWTQGRPAAALAAPAAPAPDATPATDVNPWEGTTTDEFGETYTPHDQADATRKGELLAYQADQVDAGMAPDKAAGIVRTSATTGLDPRAVAANWDGPHGYAEQAERRTDWQAVAKDHPVLADFALENPAHLALVKADVAPLSWLEFWFTGRYNAPPATGPRAVQVQGDDLVTDAETGQPLESGMGPTGWVRQLSIAIKEQELIRQQTLASYDPGNLERERNIADLERETQVDLGPHAHGLFNSILLGPPKLAPMMLGATGATVLGGPVGLTAFFTYQNLGPLAYQLQHLESKEGKKLDPSDARAIALVASFGGAKLMTKGIGEILRGFPGAERLLGDVEIQALAKLFVREDAQAVIGKAALALPEHIAGGAVAMGLQSGLNDAAHSVAMKGLDNASISYPELVLHGTKVAVDSALRAIPDLVLVSAHSGAGALMRDFGAMRASMAMEQQLRGLHEAASSSETVRAAPDLVHELVDRMRKQAGIAPGAAPEFAYVDLPQWQRYWQENKVDPREAAARLWEGGADAYDQAVTRKGDLEIPAEPYLTKIAADPQHGPGLLEDVKLTADPDVPTTRQRREELEYRQKIRTELKAVEPEKMEADQKAVFDEYRRQAIEAGQTVKTSAENARIYAAELKMLALRAGRGETAWDLWQQHPLNIKSMLGKPAQQELEHVKTVSAEYDRSPAGQAVGFVERGETSPPTVDQKLEAIMAEGTAAAKRGDVEGLKASFAEADAHFERLQRESVEREPPPPPPAPEPKEEPPPAETPPPAPPAAPTDETVARAREFLAGKDLIGGIALRDGLGISQAEVRPLIDRLVKEGVLGPTYKKGRNAGGRPVLRQPDATPAPADVPHGTPGEFKAADVAELASQPVGLAGLARRRAERPATPSPGDTRIVTPQRPQGERARYKVIEADSLVPSHDPNTFQPSPEYPTDVQSRSYHSDWDAQRTIDEGGRNLDLDIVMSDTPSPESGPPMVTEGTPIALGGNLRSMMLKRATSDPAVVEQLRERLRQAADRFGLNLEDITKFKKPVLVREVEGLRHDSPKEELAQAVNRFNETGTRKLSARDAAVAEARNMTPEGFRAIANLLDLHDNLTLRELMREKAFDLIEILRKDGFITPQSAPEMLTKDGALTDVAKDKVEGMFLGKIVGNADRMGQTAPSMLHKLERIAASLLRVEGVNPAMGELDTIRHALDVINEGRSHGMDVARLSSQGGLFGTKAHPPAVLAMARVLEERGQKELGKLFKAWADKAGFDPRQPLMFDEHPTPEQTRALLFGDKTATALRLHQEANAPDTKLDQAAVERILGKDHGLPVTKDGLAPGELADALGASPDELLRDMAEKKDRDGWVEDTAAERLAKGTKLFQEGREDRPGYGASSLKELPDAERRVVEDQIAKTEHAGQLRRSLEELAGTPWAKSAINSALARAAIEELIAGREPGFASALDNVDQPAMPRLRDALKGGGEEAIYDFLARNILSHPEKPGNALNGSFLDCEPSPACAGYCYATRGRAALDYNVTRGELVTMAVERNPVRAADMVADEYRTHPEFRKGKALRLFDRGDGSPKWLPFIEHLEGRGVRLQIFSRRPAFLREVSDFHLRLYSVDSDNMAAAGRNPELPFAFVYTGSEAEADFINRHQDDVAVVLPIMRSGVKGQSGISRQYVPREAIDALEPGVPVCPVDKGAVALAPSLDVRDQAGNLVRRFSLKGKEASRNTKDAQALASEIGGTAKSPNRQDWRCTDCDSRGGMGCFAGASSEDAAKTAGAPSAHTLRLATEELNELARSSPQLAAALSSELADLLRKAQDPAFAGGEEGVDRGPQGAPGEDGRGGAAVPGDGSEGPGGRAGRAPGDAGRRSLPVVNTAPRFVDPLEQLWRGESKPLDGDPKTVAPPPRRLYQEARVSDDDAQARAGGPAPVWYSALERAAAAAKQKIGTPDSWLAVLSKTPGVKTEEIDITGIRPLFDQVKAAAAIADVEDRKDALWALGLDPYTFRGQLTREWVQKVLAERRLELKERVKGELPVLDEQGQKIRQQYVDRLQKLGITVVAAPDGTHEFALEDKEGGTQILGTDDAREWLDMKTSDEGLIPFDRAQLEAIAHEGEAVITLDDPGRNAEVHLVDGKPVHPDSPAGVALDTLQRAGGNRKKAREWLEGIHKALRVDAGLDPAFKAVETETGWYFQETKTEAIYGHGADTVDPQPMSRAEAEEAAKDNSKLYLEDVRKSDMAGIAKSAELHRQALEGLDALEGKKVTTWSRKADESRPVYESYTLGGHVPGSYRELLLYPPGGAEFRSPHFEGDDKAGLGMHLRVSEHTSTDGKPVLVFEEGQADLMQEGAEQGYRDQAAIKRDRDIVQKWSDGLATNPERMAEQINSPRGWANTGGRSDMPDVSPRDLDRYNAPADVVAAYGRLHDAISRGAVPDVPWKDSWTELLVRRFLKYAADKGYTRVALTKGEVHAQRWGSELIAWERAQGALNVLVKLQHRGNVAGIGDLEQAALARGLIKEAKPQPVAALTDLIEQMRDEFGERWSEKKLLKVANKLWTRMQTEDAGAHAPREEFYKLLYDQKFKGALAKELKRYGGKLDDGSLGKEYSGYQATVVPEGDTFRVQTNPHNQLPAIFVTRGEADLVAREYNARRATKQVYSGELPEEGRQQINLEGMRLFQDDKVDAKLTIDLSHLPGSKLRPLPPSEQLEVLAGRKKFDRATPEEIAAADQSALDAAKGVTPKLIIDLEQKPKGGGPRGYIELNGQGGFDLALLDSDQSTLAHESFHALSFILGSIAERADAPAELKRDYQGLLEAMGYESHAQRMHAPDVVREEKASHLWEMYLADGKAPSRELAGVFAWAKKVMLGIYRGATGISQQYELKYGEPIKLSDDVRRIFDRLLATEDAMKEVRAEKQPSPPRDLEAMTPEERAEYSRLDEEDRRQGEDDLVRLAAEDDQREAMRAAKEMGERIRGQVEKDIADRDPGYKALALLQTGSIPGTQGLGDFFKDPTTGESLKLSRKATLELLGGKTEDVASLPRGIFARGKGGVSPDELAARLFMESGRELLDAIRGKDFAGAVRDEVTKRVEDKYGPALVDDPQKLKDKAREASTTEAGARQLSKRLEAIARQLDPSYQRRTRGMSLDGRREIADGILLEKPNRAIQPGMFARQEYLAHNRADQAWERGRKEEAWAHVDSALWHHIMAERARYWRDQVDKAKDQIRAAANPTWRYALGMATAGSQPEGTLRGAYRDFHDALLHALELGPSRVKEGQRQGEAALDALLMQQWNDANVGVRQVEDRDPETGESRPRLYSDLFDDDHVREFLRAPKAWGDLTPDEALNLREAIKSTRAAANDRNELNLRDRMISRADALAAMRATAARALPEQPKDKRSPILRGAFRDARLTGQAVDAHLLTMKSLIDMLAGKDDTGRMFHRSADQDSIFHQVLWDPYVDARTMEGELARAYKEPMQRAFESLPKEVRERAFERVYVGDDAPLPEDMKRLGWIDDDGYMARSDLWVMALNMGAGGPEGNKIRMLGGMGWDEGKIRALLDKNLSRPEHDWIQTTWDSLSEAKYQLKGETEGKTLFDRLADLHEKETGARPAKIQAEPFTVTFEDGTTKEYRGGYWPARYDPRAGKRLLGIKQEEQGVAQMFGETYRMQSVITGHAKKRSANYQDYVNLDWSVYPSHVSQVLHDLAFRSYVKQTAVLFLQPEFKAILKERLGEERALQFIPWLQSVANGRADSVSQVSARLKRAIGWVRGKQLMQVFGANLAIPLLHVTNPLVPAFHGLTSAKETAHVALEHASYWPGVLKNLAKEAISGEHLSLAVAKSATHWAELRQFALDNSPLLRERNGHYVSALRGDLGEMGGQLGKERLEHPFRTRARELAYYAIDQMDRKTATPIWLSRYWQSIDEYAKQGFDEPAAHERACRDAEDVLERSLPQHNAPDQPAMMRDRFGVGALFMGYGYMSRMYQLRRGVWHEGYLTAKDPTMTKTQKAVRFAEIAGVLLGSALAHQVLGDYLAGRGPDHDEEWWKWLMRKDLTADLGSIPLLGPAADIVMGKKVSLRQAPAVAVMQDAIGHIGMVANAARGAVVDGQEVDGDKAALELAELMLGGVFGVPLNQIHRTGKYFNDLRTGAQVPRSALDVGAGGVYGKELGDTKPSNPLTDLQNLISGE